MECHKEDEKKKYVRSKKPCPKCGKQVLDLPRHARGKCQKLSKEESITLLGRHDLRKRDVIKEEKQLKDYHHKRVCPIEGCNKVVIHMDQHLQSKRHGVSFILKFLLPVKLLFFVILTLFLINFLKFYPKTIFSTSALQLALLVYCLS